MNMIPGKGQRVHKTLLKFSS